MHVRQDGTAEANCVLIWQARSCSLLPGEKREGTTSPDHNYVHVYSLKCIVLSPHYQCLLCHTSSGTVAITKFTSIILMFANFTIFNWLQL